MSERIDIGSEPVDYTMLIYGEFASGKSHSFGNLPMNKVALLNLEAKPPGFNNWKQVGAYYKPSTIESFNAAVKECVMDDNIEFIVIDSLTMLADSIIYPAFIENAPLTKAGDPDTMAGWGLYKRWFVNMISKCKNSKKTFIFTALEIELYDKKEMKTIMVPKTQGSIKSEIISHFTHVMHSNVIEHKQDKSIEYVFDTRKTYECIHGARTPIPKEDLADAIPNDIMAYIEAVRAYNKEQ